MNQDAVQERSAPIKPPLERKRLILFLLELLTAIVVGALLKPLPVGGIHWIFGGIIGGAIVLQISRRRYNYTAKPNRTARQLGLILIGAVIGFSIRGDWSIAYAVPTFVLLSFFLLVSGSIIGWIYSKVGNVNLLTAMLATMPGNLLLMASIAADYRKNVALVSLVQLLRYTSIILFIPFFVRISAQEHAVPLHKTNPVEWGLTAPGISALALLTVTAGVYLAIRLKVMAAPYFGALAAAVLFNLALNWLSPAPASGFSPPHLVNILGQLLLGISIGEHWGNKPVLGQRTVAYSLISVVLTIAVGFLGASMMMQLTDWDWLTCLLIAAPGAGAELILVAMSLHLNVEAVTAAHIVRLVAINCALPAWVLLMRHLDQRMSQYSTND